MWRPSYGSSPIEAGGRERLAHHLEGVRRVAYAAGDRCGEDLAGKLVLADIVRLAPPQHDHRPRRQLKDAPSSRALCGGLDNESAGAEKARRECALLNGRALSKRHHGLA
jgi:hypothetical protein